MYRKRGDISADNIRQIVGRYTYVPSALSTVRQLQQRNYVLAIISGSMNILVEQVAKELGITLFAASNQFLFENGKLVDILTVAHDSDFKVDQLRRFCRELGISPREAWYIGDGANDAAVFAIAGESVRIGGLIRHAEAKHTIGDLDDVLRLLP